MRSIRVFVATAALACAAAAGSQQSPPPKAAPQKATTISLPRPLLPDSFAGWVAKDAPKGLTDPIQADPANAAALKEYGFQNGAAATYQREGETLTLRALRFSDLSGAYGAYSFYRGTGWPKADIGAGAASNHNRVIFWNGVTVVDATFSRIGSMSGSELRELAKQMPLAQGNKALAPPILSILPKGSLDGQTTHYAMGPAGYAGAGGALPAGLVGFDHDAEAVTADYSLTSGPATLTLIEYPTPQMAAAYETKLRAYIQAGAKAQPSFPKPLADSDQASLEIRRSGPVVALVSGDAIPEESHKLLASMYYHEDLVSVPQPVDSEATKTGQLLWSIATFVLVGAGAAILLGFFLGGGRALYRMARGRPASSVFEAEFIRLDLRD